MGSEESRLRAKERFDKLQKNAQEGAKAMADYEANSRAVRAKSERLKALRLAKEADEQRLAAEAPPKPKPKPKAKPKSPLVGK
jgi:hypothetical protein